MNCQQPLILSFSDILHAVKKKCLLLISIASLVGSITFILVLSKPIQFTTKGIFNGHITNPVNPWVKALEVLQKEEALHHSENFTLIKSYPVLEQVVRSLDLQATLKESQFGEGLREAYYKLKTAHAYAKFKKKTPPSNILMPSVYTANSLIIPDYSPLLRCQKVNYLAEHTLFLKIHFLDEKYFRVFTPKKELGIGSLGTSFAWPEGSFTLTGKGKKGKKISLYLIPIEAAVASLQQAICVEKNKKNDSLIEIFFTHRDRLLATNIVNAVMEQFQNYLVNSGKAKIETQLQYLEQRQQQAMAQLEQELNHQKLLLEKDLNLGIIVTLEKELEFMVKTQSEKRQELLKIISEIQVLASLVFPNLSLEQLIEFSHLAKNDHSFSKDLDINTTRILISQHQQQLEEIHLDSTRYDFCLEKLTEQECDSSSLAKTLKEDSLKVRFEKIDHLHHQAMDTKNWTTLERERLKDELQTEKECVRQQIYHLKEGNVIQRKILTDHLLHLQKTLIFFLVQQYEHTLSSLNELSAQSAHFPQKWLNQQKIHIHTTLYTKMFEAITQLVEAKNIGYHIDYSLSAPLQKASAPLFPNHPHLFFSVMISTLATFLISCFILCLHQAWTGPNGNFTNLLTVGKRVLLKDELLSRLGVIIQKGNIFCLASKQEIPFLQNLMTWLEKSGETVLCLNLRNRWLSENTNTRDAYLTSKKFKEELLQLKTQYDRIIIYTTCCANSFEMHILADYVDNIIYGVSGEKLDELHSLPASTIFFIQENSLKKFSLQDLKPLLEKLFKGDSLKNFFFSSWKAWRDPLKKI